MKRFLNLVVCGLTVLLGGCSSVTTEQASIVRTFPCAEEVALKSIATAAMAAGYTQVSLHEYQRAIRTKHDPILGLVEVDKDVIDYGLGFTVSVETKPGVSLVTFHPVSIARKPMTKADYSRWPLAPGHKDCAEIISIIDNAKARAEF